MARTDVYLDGMLRHLGAAYYEELHGRATHADVTRALDTVDEHLARPGDGVAGAKAVRRPHPDGQHRAGHWKRRVRDVMTTSVVTVDRLTRYKEIARLLTEHRISGVPVLSMGRHVVGVVSEADLLNAEDERARRLQAGQGWLRLVRRTPNHLGLTAGELMTAPAVTVQPGAPVPSAARVMTGNQRN
jgi:CBS domain-containing protein